MAVLALVFGLLALFLFGILFGPVAIVLGALAGSRGSKMGWWGMALGIAALTFSLAACGVAMASCGAAMDPLALSEPAVTHSEFQRIRTGMTYGQVVEIIGIHGEEMSRTEMPGVPGVMASTVTVMYAWSNPDGSNMNAMFQNDALISKAQFGLR